jgi:hypothetical protein
LILVGRSLGHACFGESFLYSTSRDRAPDTSIGL